MITGKVGYGTVSEALAYKVPFVYVRRDYFNEEPFLRKMLEVIIYLPAHYRFCNEDAVSVVRVSA